MPSLTPSLRPRPLALACLLTLLAGCAVGPDYHRPGVDMPIAYKEAAGWKQAAPSDDQPRSAWWQAFGDEQLDALMRQVEISNQNVAQYAAQYAQAQAVVRQADASFYPTVTATASGTRSGNASGTTGSKTSTSSTTRSGVSNEVSASGSLSWELDLWGKLRRTREEDVASAQASRADLANALLSAQSSLAQDYFALRILDERIALYEKTVAAYTRYASIVENQYAEAQSSRADVAQARNQLESAKASMHDLAWQRAQYEHAIAILLGKAPAAFSLPAVIGGQMQVPVTPVGLASTLLERRPDIASSERSMAKANAAIGVAIAAYYPDLTLSASAGFQNSSASKLFTAPYRFWSLGPSFSQTLFDGGSIKAQVEQARASYDAAVASYRQTVLTALGQVEDYLAKMRIMESEMQAQQAATDAAIVSARVTRDQYEAGKINYLDVATTEATSLSAQQSLWELKGTQLTTSVQLIVALGGGWHADEAEASPAVHQTDKKPAKKPAN
ncbi:efflux transporter outer membrane subunit [Herbaspirillum sp. DW155]|uniref:efflux transporter outer membrane subunit n=1 Tax=Herbaspirillum sp. DW155 TaxID=3095609 RepID=UPI00308B7D77|nr:efflux transporter outer membrane subunit [Herbaspirillum sp. DW155]